MAILVNNALIFILPAFVYRLMKDWRDRMLLKQALFARDAMNKAALLKVLGIQDAEMMEKVEAAFREGEGNWFSYMVSVFGKNDAEQVRGMLDRSVG